MATLSKGKTFANGELVTPAKLHELVDLGTVTNIQTNDLANSAVTSEKLADNSVTSAKIVNGTIVNSDISETAGISDVKLGTISTLGKVANTATTATNTNTPSAIVARDLNGDFYANEITANLAGNASTATKLATARTIALTGPVNGTTTFDGSGNVSIATTVADDSHNHIIANIDGLQTILDNFEARLAALEQP